MSKTIEDLKVAGYELTAAMCAQTDFINVLCKLEDSGRLNDERFKRIARRQGFFDERPTTQSTSLLNALNLLEQNSIELSNTELDKVLASSSYRMFFDYLTTLSQAQPTSQLNTENVSRYANNDDMREYATDTMHLRKARLLSRDWLQAISPDAAKVLPFMVKHVIYELAGMGVHDNDLYQRLIHSPQSMEITKTLNQKLASHELTSANATQTLQSLLDAATADNDSQQQSQLSQAVKKN